MTKQGHGSIFNFYCPGVLEDYPAAEKYPLNLIWFAPAEGVSSMPNKSFLSHQQQQQLYLEFATTHNIDALIIANGEKPNPTQTIWLSTQDLPIVVTDGASAWAWQQGLMVDAIVGDMDSLTDPEVWQSANVEIHHDPDQNTNDLHKALKFVQHQGWSRALILGLHGQRSDHMLANLLLLRHFSSDLSLAWLDHHGFGWIAEKTARLKACKGRAVSMFAIGEHPVTGLTTRGLKYPLTEAELKPYSPEASLNVIEGEEGVISHQTGTLMIYQAFHP